MTNFHEDYQDHFSAPDLPTKIFGFTAGVILCTIGLIKGLGFGWWIAAGFFILMGCSLIATAFFRPHYLETPKAMFLKIAPMIARVMNPVLMGFIYLLCFIPGGLILKALKRDPLHRAYSPYATTYWTRREKHGLPYPMKYQF